MGRHQRGQGPRARPLPGGRPGEQRPRRDRARAAPGRLRRPPGRAAAGVRAASRPQARPHPADQAPVGAAAGRPDGAWPEICDQFGSHLLVLAEQLRASLNLLEEGEDDPERLKRLYQVDHAVTRMHLASRQLRTLAGRSEERLAGFTTSLLDVIRMATSAIEWYPQVSVGPVVELAVPGYAADDVATLMSALLDNATRYSPGPVTVSCHLLEEGGALLRIEDTGIGIGRGRVARLNAVFAGPVPEVDKSTGRHTGFPVVHRIARKHSIGVRFASRRAPGTGTVAMVILPPQLLCAIPVEATPPPTAPDEQPAPPTGPPEPGTALAVLPEPAMPAVVAPEAEAPVAVVLEAMAPVVVAPEAEAPVAVLPEPEAPVTVLPEAVAPGAAAPAAIAPAVCVAGTGPGRASVRAAAPGAVRPSG